MTNHEKVSKAIEDLKQVVLLLPYVNSLKPVENRRGSHRSSGISIVDGSVYYQPKIIEAMTVTHIKAEITVWALPMVSRELSRKVVS